MPSRHVILVNTFKIAFLIITIRLFYWQIIQGPNLKKQALGQTQKVEKIIPQRGKIFTTDDFPIATNLTNYQLSIYKPNLKKNLDQIINLIDDIKPNFAINNGDIIDKFKNNPRQLWISFPTQFSQKEQEILSLPGISFQNNYSRYYPETPLANNIIGFVGQNQQGSRIGYGGLEAYYDKQLRGITGFIKTAKDATGQTILSQEIWQSNTLNGRNLHTSINRQIQHLVEQKLKLGLDKYLAESGSIILMDPKNGHVLAMASLIATSSATPSAGKNSAITDLFEPGSIFKPLIVAMALETKSIDHNYTCPSCDRPRTIGQYTINNWDEKVYPDTNLENTIKNSDNISMSFIIDKLGQDNFLDYFEKLYLNQKTGIDLQGEARPITKKRWSAIDLATASFGQGFAITQIQMITAFNTIANDGSIIKPSLVNYLSENNKIIKNKAKKSTKIFNTKTTDQIKDLLKYATENSNLAKIKPENMEICAKSGTAQIAHLGQYVESSTIASFIGFSPCHLPKFSLIVTLVKPKTSPWGSTTAAPIWFDLAQNLINLL